MLCDLHSVLLHYFSNLLGGGARLAMLRSDLGSVQGIICGARELEPGSYPVVAA